MIWPPGRTASGVTLNAEALPAASITFDKYVDHLCKTWLGKPSDARLLLAARQAVSLPADTVITSKHAVAGWQFPRLVAALIDSPDHMTT